MKKQFDILKNYLFLRCFAEEEYLNSFASGKCMYLNSIEKFWEIENKFQGDPSECCVISPNSNIKWSCWTAAKRPEQKLFDAPDFRISIRGFLYCMFIIPKSFFQVRNDSLQYDCENPICQDFIKTLNCYRAATDNGCAYICIFDAYQFINRVENYFEKHNLSVAYGPITYKNEDEISKLQYMNEGHLEKIIFSKAEKYKYQHEFRIFVSGSTQENDHLQLTGIPIDDIIFFRGTMIQDWR